MVDRKNKIGPAGVGRQVSQHSGDRAGRQMAALGASDMSIGSNLKVNGKGQLVVQKAKLVDDCYITEDTSGIENEETLANSINKVINALKDVGLMDQ